MLENPLRTWQKNPPITNWILFFFPFFILIDVRLAYAKPCAKVSAACRVVSAKTFFEKRFRKVSASWLCELSFRTPGFLGLVDLSGLAACCYCCSSFGSTYCKFTLKRLSLCYSLLCLHDGTNKNYIEEIAYKGDFMFPHAFREASARLPHFFFLGGGWNDFCCFRIVFNSGTTNSNNAKCQCPQSKFVNYVAIHSTPTIQIEIYQKIKYTL